MNTMISPLRRFGATFAIAGIAALGSVAVAPAASAATPVQDGASYIIERTGNGPDAFVVTTKGRIPVFFCEDVKPGKDGVMDDKDVARAVAKAAKEAQHAADEADKAAKHAADEAEKAAKDADKAAKEIVDRVMKQHNICVVMKPGGARF